VVGVVNNVLNDQGPPECQLGGGGRYQGNDHETLDNKLAVLWVRQTVEMALQEEGKF
jgi:hypothetical protein